VREIGIREDIFDNFHVSKFWRYIYYYKGLLHLSPRHTALGQTKFQFWAICAGELLRAHLGSAAGGGGRGTSTRGSVVYLVYKLSM
jgi:hypothetical protein